MTNNPTDTNKTSEGRYGDAPISDKEAWLETLNSAGIEAVVCKGFEEAKKFITDRVELNNNNREEF